VVRPTESRSALGVSHPLDGFLRVGPAGLLHPAAGYEVRCVSRRPPHLRRGGVEPSVSRNAVTLRRVPLVSSRSASLRSLPPCCCLPSSGSHVPGFPREPGRGGPPMVRAIGLPRGRKMAEATVAEGRSLRNPRGYLPRRPKPSWNPCWPKPAGPSSMASELRFHRGGRRSDRQGGRFEPSRPRFDDCRSSRRGGGVPAVNALHAEA
jgi:hypothetical protein